VTRIVPKSKQNDTLAPQNFNPVLAWSMGCQMTNINFNASLAVDCNIGLNAGMFQQMGCTGYIQKPPSLLDEQEKPPLKKLKIRILSGSCLPSPIIQKKDETAATDNDILRQTSVCLELHDIEITGNRKQEKLVSTTHKVKCLGDNGKGFAPIFHDKGTDFVVQTPDVAMLLFQVTNADSGVVGMAAIPVSCLRRGYRSVHLYSKDGTRHGPYAFATLLVYLQYH
jgi:phosphatidylinositol phospholipase C, delta